MNARSMHGDNWDWALNDEWRLEGPSWDNVDRALQRLDATTHTLVTIQGAGERHMAIGGGAGRYVGYATFDNLEFWNLLASHREDGLVSLNAVVRRATTLRHRSLTLRAPA